MGFNIETNISAFIVFLQGLISFFSPCVLPLVPLYLSYLAGGAASADLSDRERQRKTMLNTLFFVIGISFTFFLLGLGFTSMGQFFTQNRAIVARVGGIIIILMGLVQIGFLSSKLMSKELRLPFNISKWSMNPLTALILGFTFSFAWTPCVGPALTTVLVMAGSSATRGQGLFLIGIYTLGFVIPFLLVGLFTSKVLSFFKSHYNWLRWTAKAGGVLMILIGIMMFTGWMNSFTGYLSGVGTGLPSTSQNQSASQPADSTVSSQPDSSAQSDTSAPESSSAAEDELPDAPDFTLVDQYGNTHTLSDYKGKVVFLNFWATWCGPCKMEMPEIDRLYKDMGENQDEVIVLGIANPKSSDYPKSVDTMTSAEIANMMNQSGYSYPTVMDTTGEVFSAYGISAFPTTFMIDKEGKVFGYISGALNREIMDSIIEQTISGVRQ